MGRAGGPDVRTGGSMSRSAQWELVRRDQLPPRLRFFSLPQDQGQIVLVSYGSFGRSGPDPKTDLYKRIHDQSEGPAAVRYYRRVATGS